MRFGPVPLEEAEGAVLAHSIAVPGGRLRKGQRLGAEDIAALAAAGYRRIIAARLDPGDVPEDAAAWRLAAAVTCVPAGNVSDAEAAAAAAARGLRLEPPFTGRVNLRADRPGVLVVDAGAIDAVNAVDPLLTFATAAPWARVRAGQMVATVKVIAYAVAEANLVEAERRARAALRVAPFRPGTAVLLQTAVPGQAPALHEKGRAVTEARLAPLGWRLQGHEVVAHEVEALADALSRHAGTADMVLILTGSATSDPRDVGPEAVRRAGGHITRFGMPVDPGNLLFIGGLSGRPVVGLPGCARSPARNGADLVIERLAAGLAVGDEEIAAMGVGGLLKEIPVRPQPREGHTTEN